jgi:hypothetical protein
MTKKAFSIKITQEVPEEKVQNLLTNGFDHAISYWASVKGDGGWDKLNEKEDYRSDLPLAGGFVVLEDSTGEGFPDPEGNPFAVEGGVILNRASVERGLQVMGAKYPRHFGNMMSGNDDADTADVLIQCAVFGDIIFG